MWLECRMQSRPRNLCCRSEGLAIFIMFSDLHRATAWDNNFASHKKTSMLTSSRKQGHF